MLRSMAFGDKRDAVGALTLNVCAKLDLHMFNPVMHPRSCLCESRDTLYHMNVGNEYLNTWFDA